MIRLFLSILFSLVSISGYCQSILGSSKYQALKIKLEAINDLDQQYRTKGNVDQLYDAQYKFGIKSEEYQNIYHLITSNDSIAQLELMPILDRYGWLGKSQIGEKANEAIFYGVQHSNNVMRLKYIPLMRVSVAKGESDSTHLKWLEDRILHEQGFPTKYHSQYYDVPRRDGTVDHYESRLNANEELRKEGLDTITGPHPR